jgi:hypothetical protein
MALSRCQLYVGHDHIYRILFTGSTVEAQQFQKNLCSFNYAFAFTSMGCNINWRLEDQGGIQPLAIHGQLSYHAGRLEIADGLSVAMRSSLSSILKELLMSVCKIISSFIKTLT